MRGVIDEHTAAVPTILEMPSKDTPYDPASDSVMARVRMLLSTS